MTCRILQGDWLEVLRTLPDESVHCVVTSPPYWGLRDYGTATWEGGDAECKHVQPRSSGSSTLGIGKGIASHESAMRRESECPKPYIGQCGKCGAVRIDAQLGLERTPDEYVAKMVEGFREVRRVLRSDGTCWVNLGDSYKAKDLVGIPWRVAFALQADGWWLRQDIIWSKPNPMPESVRDRCTKSHEYVFMLNKNDRYFYDAEAIKEAAVSTDIKKFTDGGRDKQRGHSRRHAGFNGRYAERLDASGVPATRNRRSVWEVSTKPFAEAHFATFPPEIPETCIKAGCPIDGTVLDPFNGAGTTGQVATRLGRNYIGIELNPAYVEMAARRIVGDAPMFNEVTE